MLTRTFSVLLITAASGFAVTVGALAEARTPTTVLLATGMLGGDYPSYMLSIDQSRISGTAVSLGANLLPSILRAANDSTVADVDDAGMAPVSTQVFIMDPNLGFTVVLNQDFSFEGGVNRIDDPGNVMFPTQIANVGNTPGNPVITTGDASGTGVSDVFVDAPIDPGAIADAGAVFTDGNAPPTVIVGGGNTIEIGPGNDASNNGAATAGGTDDGSNPPAAGAQPIEPGVIDTSAEAVPEPSTVVGVAGALLCLAVRRARKVRG